MKMIVKIQMTLMFQYSIAQYNGILGYVHNYPDHEYDYHHYENEYYDRPKQRIRKIDRHRRKIYRINGERYPNRIIRKHQKHRSYEDYGCKCSCRNCAKLKRCCIGQCSECQNQANLMYVPYPVPIVVDVPSIFPPPAITPDITVAPTSTAPPTSTTTVTTTIATTQVTTPSFSTQPPYLTNIKPCASLANCKEYNDRRYYMRNNYQRLLPNRYESYNDIEIRPAMPIYEFTNVDKNIRQKNRPWLSKYGYLPFRNNLAIKFGSEIRNYE